MDRPDKRKHRANGKPKGGTRPGAGRPSGSNNTLPLGAVDALKTLRHRVPEGAPALLADLAGEGLQRIVDVMNERVHFSAAASVLKAAAMLREEVCGPVAQKLEHSGPDGAALKIVINTLPPKEG